MAMVDIILLLVFNSFLIYGFYFSTTFDGWESYPDKGYPYGRDWKNILWWVRYYGEALPWYLQKPLYLCPTCMASFHGAYVYMIYCFVKDMPIEAVYLLPLYTLALAGVNQLTGKLMNE